MPDITPLKDILQVFFFIYDVIIVTYSCYIAGLSKHDRNTIGQCSLSNMTQLQNGKNI